MGTSNRAEKLRKARRNYVVIWNRFILGYQKDAKRLFCFFEGDDSKYYSIRIELLVSTKPEIFDCDGKAGVLCLFSLISNDKTYKDACVAFFIDRDFEDESCFPVDSRLFITPCYSVENLYVSESAFQRILENEFQVTPTDSDTDFQTMNDLYKNRLSQFNRATEELNAWVFLQRKYERSSSPKHKLNLNGMHLNNLVTCFLDGVRKHYTVESLQIIFKDAMVLEEKEITEKVKSFQGVNQTNYFRGKFLIEFLRLFLIHLKEDRESSSPKYFSKSARVKLNLTKPNLISELSQYADTPESLKAFLVLLGKTMPP
ncbi:MAG: DUF4435 domain-containing protein [bacterium]